MPSSHKVCPTGSTVDGPLHHDRGLGRGLGPRRTCMGTVARPLDLGGGVERNLSPTVEVTALEDAEVVEVRVGDKREAFIPPRMPALEGGGVRAVVAIRT